MRRQARAAWLVLVTAFRADPWRTAGAVVLEGVATSSQVLGGVWLKLVTDGVIGRDGRAVVVGAIGLALTPGLMMAAGGFGVRMRLTLVEKTTFAFESRFAEVSASVATLTHHEQPEFRDKLELLQNNRMILGSTTHALIYSFIFVINTTATFFVVSTLHPLLLLLPAFGIPSAIVAIIGQRWFRRAEEETAPRLRLARHLYETGMAAGPSKELRVFGLQNEVRDRHNASWMDAHRRSMRVRWRTSLLGSLAFAFFAVGFVGAIVFVAVRAVRGEATPGDVVMAIMVAAQVHQIVSMGAQQLAWFGESLRYAGRFRWLLDHVDRERANAPTGPAPSVLREGIRFENVDFAYPGTDVPVLRDVSLFLPAGTVIALVGENGAGKTSLVKLLARFYPPTGGRITVDGIDLATIAVGEWRELMTAGFQDYAKLEFLVRQAVGVGDLPSIDDDASVHDALERSGGVDVLETLSEGLRTQLGRTWADGAELSVGQWQKLALGRALMRERPLLSIFDEPTASLDAETEHLLFERYAAEAKARRDDGAITLLASHRFSTVRSADLIVVIDDGRVVEVGSHAELMSRGGLYAELYGIQAHGYR
jgi:ATP-binding cassette subfamily B protein